MSVDSTILLIGFGTFFGCLSLHVFLWRLRHPRNHASALLLVFFVPGAGLIFFSSLYWRHLSGLDLFAISLLHVSLSCTYIQIYPASQADSPSLKILAVVGSSMPAGITETEIQTHFNREDLFTARVHDLLEAQLVKEVDGKLVLTPKGRVMVMPFLILRTIVGLSAGKG